MWKWLCTQKYWVQNDVDFVLKCFLRNILVLLPYTDSWSNSTCVNVHFCNFKESSFVKFSNRYSSLPSLLLIMVGFKGFILAWGGRGGKITFFRFSYWSKLHANIITGFKVFLYKESTGNWKSKIPPSEF